MKVFTKQTLLRAMLVMLFALAAVGVSRAQGVRYDSWIQLPNGQAVAGAQVTVCVFVATPTTPCTSPVNIYNDIGLTQLITPQGTLTTDQGGNFGFFLAPGNYVYSATGSGFAPIFRYITLSLGSGTDILPTDNTFLGSNIFQGISLTGSVEAGDQPGSDICADINLAWQKLVAQSPLGGTVTVFNAPGIQTCAASPFTNYPNNFNGRLIWAPTVQTQTSVPWVLPSYFYMDGLSTHAVANVPGAPTGAVLQAANGFPTGTPLISVSPTGISGVVVTNMRLTCVMPSGTAPSGCTTYQNFYGQEDTRVENVTLDGGDAYALDVSTSAAQNSGVYKNIAISMNGLNNPNSQCFRIGTASPASLLIASFLLEDISCVGGNNAAEPLVLGTIDANAVTVIGLHMESGVTGLAIGTGHLTRSVTVMGSNCSSTGLKPMITCFQIGNPAFASTGISIIGGYSLAGFNVTNILVDSLPNGGTIPNSAESSVTYFRGINNNILTTSGVIKSTVQQLAVSGLTPGNCVQASTGGLFVTTASPCGNGTGTFGGPNPWIDGTSFGMRSVLSQIVTTASCVSGNPVVPMLSATGFQVGDGIVLYGCGTTNTLTTPGAPTVTPAMQSGPDTNNDFVLVNNFGGAPVGSTAYSYQIMARDQNGGMTPAGTAGTTSTGWTLGNQQVAVSTLTRSGTTVTVTTSANINCSPGAIVWMDGSNDASFLGYYRIVTCVSATQFTYTAGNSTSFPIPINVGVFSTNSATGGTAQVYNINHLTWSPVVGATQYYIYKAGTLVGVTPPGETSWQDYGAVVPTLPDFVPTSAPGAAVADYLATTVTNISVNNFTLATAPSQNTSGTTAKFDNGQPLFAAYQAAVHATGTFSATLRIPTGLAGTSYFINSAVSFGNSNITVLQAGNLFLNETLQIGSANWIGMLGGQAGSSPQFDWNFGQQIQVSAAYPGIISVGVAHLSYVTMLVAQNGLAVTMPNSGAFNAQIDHFSCLMGGTDINGQCLRMYAQANSVISFSTFSTNTASGYGYSLTPLVLSRPDLVGGNGAGSVSFEHGFFVGRGYGWESPSLGSNATLAFLDEYSQQVRVPVIALGPGNNPHVRITRGQNDSSIAPLVANWGAGSSVVTLEDAPDNSGGASGRPGMVTGNVIGNLLLINSGSQAGLANATPFPGQNINMVHLGPGQMGVGTAAAGFALNVNGITNSSSFATTGIVVASLPSASTNTGFWRTVTDSTTIAAEGQTCAGGSSNTALAFSNGTVWKCF